MPETMTPARPRGPVTIGLVLRRPARDLGIDPFYVDLVAGMEDALAPIDGTVLLQVVTTMSEELEAYERWAANGEIAGVVVSDIVEGDGRTVLLRRVGLPWVLLGASDDNGGAAVVVDNAGPMYEAVLHLARLGHRSIARVAGPPWLVHTAERATGYAAALAEVRGRGRTVAGDYTAESGASCTRQLLDGAEPPTAIIYDNDVMAVAGLSVVQELGIDVPGTLSLLAWDDSALCRLATPPLSAMHRDVHALGEAAAAALYDVITGTSTATVRSKAPGIVTRGTTGRRDLTRT